MKDIDAKTWDQPQEVSDLTLAFPANIGKLMPPRDACEAALKAMPDNGAKWLAFQRHWFYKGLSKDTEFDMAEGVDGRMAFRHLKAIQGSFEPKHEHKEVAVAYLASRWFTDLRL